MNREQRVMSFIHDYLSEITFRDDKAILEEQRVSGINSEALILGETLSHANLDLLHHSVKKLCCSDLIFQGRRDLKVCKKSLRY